METIDDVTTQSIEKILVTGSVGQIGSELVPELRRRYGGGNVVAGWYRTEPPEEIEASGPCVRIDVTDREQLKADCDQYQIDTIINLAALLSAFGEQHPQRTWQVNVNGQINCLEVARELDLVQVFCPSSIAVFGAGIPRDDTPQEVVLRPSTMYGITKVTIELLNDYYVRHYGVDARGLRFPGIISAAELPEGGTTDYAVEMYYKAVEEQRYTCFVREDTRLPMMYMPDCIKATIELMEADFSQLSRHGDYNLASMSFTAGELAAAIRARIPGFEVSYEPDFRQEIADSWPNSLDDSAARRDWGWSPGCDLETMTEEMLSILSRRHAEGRLYH